jgi:hypothetical protein
VFKSIKFSEQHLYLIAVISISMAGGSMVQSLLFDRRYWTVDKAKKWASTHRFKRSEVSLKPTHIRLRQFSPDSRRYKYRILHLSPTIEGVLAFPRGEKRKHK